MRIRSRSQMGFRVGFPARPKSNRPVWVCFREGRWWQVVLKSGKWYLVDGRDKGGPWSSFESLKLEAQFFGWKLEREPS